MSKKMMKRSLALGALMAFVITGSAWAEVTVVEHSSTGTRTAGLAYTNGVDNVYSVNDNNNTITNNNSESRNYGLALTFGNNDAEEVVLQVNVDKDVTLGIDVDCADNRAQGIRVNYGNTLNVSGGKLNVDVDTTGADYTLGIGVYHKGNINTNSTIINVEGNRGHIWAVGYENDKKINLGDNKSQYGVKDSYLTINNLNATANVAEGGNIVGASYDNNGKVTGYVDDVRGIVVTYGTLNLIGDNTNVSVTNNVDTLGRVQGAMTQGDVDNEEYDFTDANINFNAKNTTFTVTNTGKNLVGGVQGIVASGPASINFNGQNASITVNGGAEAAVGLRAQHSSTVTSVKENTLGINVNSTTEESVVGISAGEYSGVGDIDFNGKTTITATNNGTGKTYGVYGEKGAEINLADTTITVTSKEGIAYGVYSNGGSEVVVKGDTVIDVSGNDIKDVGSTAAVRVEASEDITTVDLQGKNITINANGKRGINVANGTAVNVAGTAIVKLGSENTESININNASYGILAQYNGTTVDVKGKNLNITGDGTGVGIWAMNGNLTDTDSSDNAKIIVGKDTITTIGNVENAIYATSQATIDIAGDLYASGTKGVIDARGGSTVNINKEASKDVTVQLEGDIVYELDSKDVHPVDATLIINLANSDSYFKGNIYKNDVAIDAGVPISDVKGMKITLTNGAQWELSKASVVNEASFGADTVFVLKEGNVFEKQTDVAKNVYALNAGEGTINKLTVDNGAKLQIGGIKETTYNIATGFENYDAVEGWTEIADNALMEANKVIDQSNKTLQVEIKTKEAEQMATEMGISNSTAQSVANVTAAAQAAIDGGAVAKPEGTGNDKAVALVQAMANANPQAAGQAFEAVSKMAEAGGNSGTAASIVKNVTGVTNDRLSFNCGHSAPHKGGHGVGLFEEGSGADVWVEYVHGKDKVEDMPSTAGKTSYEGQYNGIVMGVDFKKVNKFQSGFAFNYGEGDTNSVGSAAHTHSDYDFWGIGYYGSIHNDDSNVIFDIGYAKTDSDVETKALGMTYNASPETTTWTAGVKVEKLYQNENVQIVPYTGLRFMSIDPEDYSTECASSKYQMERQNVWLLPLGVSIKQEVTNDNGWTVSPRVDLSYIWAFGDTDSEMEFSTLGTKTNIGYEVMDDGSFLGLVGIEAHKGQWGYGVSYSYQKGDHSESKKWYVDVNYSF